jgi:hypothetical protein
MNRIARALAAVVGLLIGVWLLSTYAEPVIAVLTPYLGGAAVIVAIIVLLAGPAMVLGALVWRLT